MIQIVLKTALILNILILFVNARKGFGPGEQDWGYVPVRPKAHMFWWLYETTANVTHRTDIPLVIWLQGGPGSSSTGFGNFVELGPLDINRKLRNHTWVKNVNVLFIDNPVGTGFSYVDSTLELSKSSKQTTEDLVTCLTGFYEKHPEFHNVPLYIIGESYGGKFTVEFALELHKKIKNGSIQSNLQGIVLVDSWISSFISAKICLSAVQLSQWNVGLLLSAVFKSWTSALDKPIDSVLTWASYLYNVGVVDREGYNKIDASAQKVQSAIESGQFGLAKRGWIDTQGIVKDITSEIDWYNILTKVPSKTRKGKSTDDALRELMNGPVKTALGLNATWIDQSTDVFEALAAEFMKPDTDIVEQILNNTDIKVSITSGQLDLIVDTPGTVHWVDHIRWSKSAKWQETPRVPLSIKGFIEGYKKVLGKLTLYWVNRSGHMVPKDNPAAMEEILNDLIKSAS